VLTEPAFFRSAKTVTDVTPDRVTADGHDGCPRAIRTELDRDVRHPTSVPLSNRLEQDHCGISRCQPMRRFTCPTSAARFCQGYDELRNFVRSPTRQHQQVPAGRPRLYFVRGSVIVWKIFEAACRTPAGTQKAQVVLHCASPDRAAP
jgi:putative transposase